MKGVNASYDLYLPLLQRLEGGFQKNPDDPGNFNSKGELAGTNFGISARFYEAIIKRPPSEKDMRSITIKDAANILKQHFWDRCLADDIKDQYVANTIVDHHINSGSGIRLVQQVLNRSFKKNLLVDNVMGPLTLNAINSVNPEKLVFEYNKAREKYYYSIGNETYISGWLTRLKNFAYENRFIISASSVFFLLTAIIIFHSFKN